MSDNAQQPETFDAVKARLEEIAEAVADESLPLDDALDLYEEAVALGLRASDLLEEGIDIANESAATEGDGLPAAAEGEDPDGQGQPADEGGTASR